MLCVFPIFHSRERARAREGERKRGSKIRRKNSSRSFLPWVKIGKFFFSNNLDVLDLLPFSSISSSSIPSSSEFYLLPHLPEPLHNALPVRQREAEQVVDRGGALFRDGPDDVVRNRPSDDGGNRRVLPPSPRRAVSRQQGQSAVVGEGREGVRGDAVARGQGVARLEEQREVRGGGKRRRGGGGEVFFFASASVPASVAVASVAAFVASSASSLALLASHSKTVLRP